MKKFVIKKVIIVVVVLFLVVMGVQVLKKLQHKEQVQQALAVLPEFSFYTLGRRFFYQRTTTTK